jgi:putative hydrolase of the HAD superfamily
MRAILFDAGNTLLHLDYPWLAALAKRLGSCVSADDLGRATGEVSRKGWPAPERPKRPTEFFEGYFGAIAEAIGLGDAAQRAFARAVEAEHLGAREGMWRRAAPDASAVLATLQARGFLLGVVSNSDGRVEEQLAAAGLRDMFGTVVDSYVVRVEKPDPRIFRLALDRLGVEAGDACYVGDLLEIDVKGAMAAGLAAYLYDPWDAHPGLRDGRLRSLTALLSLEVAKNPSP